MSALFLSFFDLAWKLVKGKLERASSPQTTEANFFYLLQQLWLQTPRPSRETLLETIDGFETSFIVTPGIVDSISGAQRSMEIFKLFGNFSEKLNFNSKATQKAIATTVKAVRMSGSKRQAFSNHWLAEKSIKALSHHERYLLTLLHQCFFAQTVTSQYITKKLQKMFAGSGSREVSTEIEYSRPENFCLSPTNESSDLFDSNEEDIQLAHEETILLLVLKEEDVESRQTSTISAEPELDNPELDSEEAGCGQFFNSFNNETSFPSNHIVLDN